MTIDWVKGNGAGVLVLMREGDSPPDLSCFGTGEDYNLTASDNANFSSAGVLCGGSDPKPTKLVGKIVGSTSTIPITGLTANTKYQVMVVEYNVDGSNIDVLTSTASFNPRSKSTLPSALGPPTGLTTTARTATTATITWTDNVGAVGYYLDVQYDKDYLTEYDLLDIGDYTPDEYLITGLTHPSDSKYRYRMRSYDAQGNISSATNWVDFTTASHDPTVLAGTNPVSVCGYTFSISATISSASGYFPNPATGTWTMVSKPSGATASFTPDIYTASTSVTVSAYGDYVFEFTIKVGAYYHSDTYSVTTMDAPTANAGTYASWCGQTYALAATALNVGQTGTWTYISGPGGTQTFSNAYSPTSNAWVSNAGAHTYRWTITTGTCTAQDDVVITYTQAPTTASAGTDGSKCGLTGYTLSGNTPSVGTGSWTKVSGPGSASFGTASIGNTTVGVTAEGTYTFEWKITNGTCTSADQVDVIFYQTPTTATVGNANTSNCGFTMTLDGSTPSFGTGTWTKVSGPGTASFVNANLYNTSVTVDQAGAWSFAWSISNGTCSASTVGKQVTFYTNPTAEAGTAFSSCSTTTTLGATAPSPGAGTWSYVSGTATPTFGTPTSPTSTVTVQALTSSNEAYTLRWTVINGACTVTDDVVVTFYQAPTTANAGPNQSSVCGTVATLAATPVTIGTGSWTVLSGAGTPTFGTSSSPTSSFTIPTFSGATSAYTLIWTTTNGTCTSNDDVTITFKNTPTANAGTDASACGLSYTLSATTSTLGTGSWTQVSGVGTATFGTASAPTPTLYNSTVTIPSFGGNSTPYTFNWTLTNGTCTSGDDVVITFYNTPATASAGPDQSVCGTSGTLAGNTPTFGTGSWTQVSGVGTASFGTASLYNSSVTIPSFSGNSTVYTLKWTISNGTCTSEDNVMITFYNTPTTSSAGPDQSVCGTSGTFAGNAASAGTGSWTKVSGTGTPTFGTPTSPISTFSVPALTNANEPYTFAWTIINGTCTTTDQVLVTFYHAPTTADAGSNGTWCDGLFGYALSGNAATYGTGSWTKVNGPGNVAFGDATYNESLAEPDAYGTYTYRWTITNGTCSSSSDDVSVTYYEAPTTASAGSNATICSIEYTLAGNTPSVGTGTWTLISGPAGGTATFNNEHLATSDVTVSSANLTTPYVFRWSIGNGTCTPSTADVSITFSTELVANAGNDDYACFYINNSSGEYELQATTPLDGTTGTWTLVNGPGSASFSDETAENSTVTVNALGAYTFGWTVTNGECSTTDVVVITFVKFLDYGNTSINGLAEVNKGSSNVEYSIPAIEGALNYTWTYTPGSDVTIVGTSPASNTYTTTNVINVSFGLTSTTGTLSITPNGLCGAGGTIWKAITVVANPVILTGTLQNDNSYITITTNYDVYTNNDGTGNLAASDFQLIFTKGSGNATGASISSVTKVNLKTWKLNLSYVGTPNGCEKIEIRPLTNEIFTYGTPSVPGTAMATSETSGIHYLYNMNQPTTAATAATGGFIPAASVYSSQMTLNWNIGGGSKRIVVAKEGSSPAAPADFVDYTANAQFGIVSTTSTTAAGSYVVYNGTGNTVTVTGLTPNTVYYFTVYEYNQACATANYMPTGLSGNATTTTQASQLVILASTKPTLVKSGEVWSTFTIQAKDESGNLRAPICNETITITDGTSGGTWVNNSGTISTSQTSLTLTAVKYTKAEGAIGTTFTVEDGSCGYDITHAEFTVNVRPVDPTTHASAINFNFADQTSIGLYWTKGSGNGRALLVNYTGTVPVGALADGNDITSVSDPNPADYSTALTLSSGTKVVYRDNSGDANKQKTKVCSLAINHSYNFRVVEYNYAGTGTVAETYNFKTTTSGLTGNPRSQSTMPPPPPKLGSFNGVEVSDLRGRSYDAKADLNWEAFSEDGLTRYEIYRTMPIADVSEEFVKIGDVDVKTAIGSSNIYKLIDNDNSLIVGNEYLYRLVGIGFDGKQYSVSEVTLTILSMPNNDVSLYLSPVTANPVKDVVRFNVQTVKSAPVLVEIRNSIGQVIFTEERTINGIQNYEYNMNAKAAGTYYITVSSGQEAAISPFVFVP
jgi:hypothetical protein